jgi:uncharacterized protein (TIGR03437 family)
MSDGLLSSNTINPKALRVEDFTGTGVADIAFANYSNYSVGILHGKEKVFEAGALAGAVSIASADFNGDGKPDLAVASVGGAVSVLLGNGDETFQPGINYSVGSLAINSGVGITAGDFDGDGKVDLVVANPKGVGVLSGNGDGTFQSPVYYGSPSNVVLVADFNRDGRSDLAIANTGSSGFSILLGAAAPIALSGVANAASRIVGAPLSPGSLAVVYGTFAADTSGLTAQFGNGLTAPVLAVSSGQATIQVPWELSGQSQATLSMTLRGQTSNGVVVNLSSFAPGIFTVNGSGTGQAAIYDSLNHLVDTSNPAIPGVTTLQIYATGLGEVAGQPVTGSAAPANPPSLTTTTPTVTIGTANAPVLFSGLVPGLVGVDQLNVLVPPSVSAGASISVTISWHGITSNTPTIAVQ